MKICILYTNSGAGHIAAAKALKTVFEQQKNVQVDIIDFSVKYQIPIFKGAQKSYKFILKHTMFLQPYIVKFFDMALPAYVFRKLFTTLSKSKLDKFLKEYPADYYISTYYTDTEIFRAIKKNYPKAKTMMVIVDIMHALRLWFDPITDLTVIPTQEVYDMGSKYFMKYSEKVVLYGLPVAQNLFDNVSKYETKAKLGLNQNPMIFIAGGGEGMEQVPEIVKTIDVLNDNITLCVVCGKDIKQKEFLEKQIYKNEVKIFGWVENFTEFTLASDVVVTKAGPATVWETISAGRKMIVYGFIAGVEDGDVSFAINNGDVIFEKDPQKIGYAIPSMLSKPDPIVSEQFRTNWAKRIVGKAMEIMNS